MSDDDETRQASLFEPFEDVEQAVLQQLLGELRELEDEDETPDGDGE